MTANSASDTVVPVSTQLLEHFNRVRERIELVAAAAGRTAEEIVMMAVTKTHPVEVVADALDAGIRVLGENRVQEAVSKYEQLRQLRPDADYELHLIGHLQRNKARQVPEHFPWVDSIDSVETAHAIARHLPEGATVHLLLQLNSSGEQSKSGFAETAELIEAAEQIRRIPGLDIRGVMTIGPFTTDTGAISRAFSRTRDAFERLRTHVPTATILSMGMSDDFQIAIQEGATMIRLGTVLFGGRNT